MFLCFDYIPLSFKCTDLKTLLQSRQINFVGLHKLDCYSSVNATSAHPPGKPRGICSGCLSRRRGICAPWERPPPPPGNLIHEVTKSSEARAVKMPALFFRDGGFCGERYGFHVTVACPRRTIQACCDFLREFSNFRKFSSAL